MSRLFSGLITLSLLFVLTGQAEARSKKKTYDEAKKECLAEDSSLSGKRLQACIKKKRR